MDEYKPVCWLQHGPYEDGEPMQCVFEDPKDDDCYSPLYGGPTAEAATDLLAALLKARSELVGLPRSLGYEFTHLPEIDAALAKAGIVVA